MLTRRSILALGTGAVALLVTGCTSFTPVYGDVSGSGAATARFNFAEPNNRLEQIILQRLRIAFPNPASANDPVLSVSASSRSITGGLSDAFDISRPTNVRVEATVTITQGDTELLSVTRFTDTSYQGDRLTLTDNASAEGARETAAASTAEALRAALLATYRPGSALQP